MHGDSGVLVYFARLSELLRTYALNVTGPEVEAVRSLCCTLPKDADGGRDWVRAPFADAERWRTATDTFLRTAERLRSQEREATLHLSLPLLTGRTRRLLWSVRHARRNRVLRRDHDATMERLRAEMLSAYRAFRDQAADLTSHIKAERDRYERERREDEERDRRKRAEVMAGPLDVPRWAYRIEERKSLKYRVFWVELETLDAAGMHGEAHGGLTPSEVHAALLQEREQDPYLWLMFDFETSRALTEWRGTTKKAWREITGRRVKEHPTRPEERRTSGSSYGPSSNYFSPGGFGSVH